MRVLMLGWEFPPHAVGGLGTACRGFADGLGGTDADVTLVLPRLFGDEPDVPVELVGVESASAPLPSVYAAPDERLDGDVFETVAAFADAVARRAQTDPPEVIHAHDWTTFPAGIAAAEATGAPLVVHVHSCEYDRAGTDADPRIVRIEQQALDAADRVVAVSRYTANRLRTHYRVAADKLRVVHNAVDAPLATSEPGADTPTDDEPPVVLFLGRVTAQKGPELFLEAAARVVPRLPQVRFVLAGDGPLLARMVERAAELGLSRHVRFTGYLHGDQVDRMYERASVYVLPSVSEPFGLAPLEALSRDVPVIVSKASGIAELLRGVVTVDVWDVDSLADRIVEVLEAPAEHRERAADDARRVRRTSWVEQAAELVAVWDELVG